MNQLSGDPDSLPDPSAESQETRRSYIEDVQRDIADHVQPSREPSEGAQAQDLQSVTSGPTSPNVLVLRVNSDNPARSDTAENINNEPTTPKDTRLKQSATELEPYHPHTPTNLRRHRTAANSALRRVAASPRHVRSPTLSSRGASIEGPRCTSPGSTWGGSFDFSHVEGLEDPTTPPQALQSLSPSPIRYSPLLQDIHEEHRAVPVFPLQAQSEPRSGAMSASRAPPASADRVDRVTAEDAPLSHLYNHEVPVSVGPYLESAINAFQEDVQRAARCFQSKLIAIHPKVAEAEDEAKEEARCRQDLANAQHLASTARASLEFAQASGAPRAQLEGCRRLCSHLDQEVLKKTEARDAVVSANASRQRPHERECKQWHAAMSHIEPILSVAFNFPKEDPRRKRLRSGSAGVNNSTSDQVET